MMMMMMMMMKHYALLQCTYLLLLLLLLFDNLHKYFQIFRCNVLILCVITGQLKLTAPTSIRPITFIYPDDRSSIFLLPACILSKTVSSVSRSFINSSWCAEIHICAHNRIKVCEKFCFSLCTSTSILQIFWLF
jgi:hypothetical protein